MRGLSLLTLAALPAASLAFAPAASIQQQQRLTTLSAIVTGPNGKAASSKEEDLALTCEIIMAAIGSSDANDGVVDDDDAAAPATPAAATLEAAPEEQPKKKKKKKKKTPPPEEVVMDISKLDIRIGTILEAWEHEDADKLFCEKIDMGEDEPRTIATGVRAYYNVEDLVGRKVCVLANLKTRKLMGFPSHGMVLCASKDDKVVFVEPPADAANGERVACEGFVGEAATENQVGKKKILDKVFPDFMTDGEGVVTYKGIPLTAGGGQLVSSLADAEVA
mmetsp:Transcript_24476/g.46877  ORF Transcript_24476/g.46877 Transcript_24476/m.46877 type:complete len:278 (+) Transcript_24476:104-937(+)